MWTTQNIFNHVVNHLRGSNVCRGMYSNPSNDCFCAKGCMMYSDMINTLLCFYVATTACKLAINYKINRKLSDVEWELLNDLEWVLERESSPRYDFNICNLIEYKNVGIRNADIKYANAEDCYKVIAQRYNLIYSSITAIINSTDTVVNEINEIKQIQLEEV